jgi:hypothetical protein
MDPFLNIWVQKLQNIFTPTQSSPGHFFANQTHFDGFFHLPNPFLQKNRAKNGFPKKDLTHGASNPYT